MKIAMCLCLMSFSAFAYDTYVHNYNRNDGTQVQAYHRTTPDNNPYNNYEAPSPSYRYAYPEPTESQGSYSETMTNYRPYNPYRAPRY